jgi:hypothetical protein
MDGLAEFVRAFPAWTIPAWMFWRRDRGHPVTWVAYCHGMGNLARSAARDSLRMANAARAAQTDDAGWTRFTAEMENAAR